MRSTIDSGGRVVIPKSIRETLGLRPGTVLDIDERDGHIEIAPAVAPMTLVEVGGSLVGTSTEALPALTDDVVRDTLEGLRR